MIGGKEVPIVKKFVMALLVGVFSYAYQSRVRPPLNTQFSRK